ncbi:hypothetical protein [Paenibacillus sp. FSL W7-1287]|uniref:hypothetical protein n=1 Tax=Paenibacillus sp. FSL W7-1287 TaxID=2954538 RepID=UPI0030FA7107
MSRKRLIENINYTSEDLDYTRWSVVHFDNRNETFEKRKQAIELYIDNQISIADIKKITGIDRKELNKLLRKCLTNDKEGRQWGYRALIPYKRVGEKYLRIESTSGLQNPLRLTGAFKQLLEQYPVLPQLIDDYILNRRKRPTGDNVIRIIDLRNKFLKLCRSEGIKLNEYPFNTLDKGLRSLYRYVETLTNENIRAASSRYGDEAERKLKDLDGTSSPKELTVVPYECVYFDGHKIDALLSITFKNAYGDDVVETMSRIWLLVIMDDATRAVLGHILCLQPEYSSYDVLHCIKKTVIPWKPIVLTIPGLEYPEKPGYPSAAFPEAQWALWNELKYDNALANLSTIVKDRLTSIVNCSVNPGKVRFPEGRAIIERFFGLLENNYIHRLVNTTGSNPKDPKRKNPEKAAIKYEIRSDELEQLIEVAIARYNNEMHSTLGMSPLEAMEQRILYRDMVPRILDEEKRNDINFFSLRTHRVVKGSKQSGKRPHINYEGVQYSSSLLSKNFSLVGTELTIEVNIDDITVLQVFLPDGEALDYIRARGPWSKKSHSLRTRKVINKLVREGKLKFDNSDCIIEVFERHLEEKANNKKTARNQLAALQKYNQLSFQKDEKKHIEEEILMIETDTTLSSIDTINQDNTFELLKNILKTNC